MADAARKWAWLSLVLWAVTVIGFLGYAASRVEKKPADGGPVEVTIDSATCQATPAEVAIDLATKPRTDRPNHYQVLWKVNFANQAAASVRIVHDPAKSTNAAKHSGVAFPETFDIERNAGQVLSGPPAAIHQQPSYWAYTIQVIGREGELLCPPVDPGLCFPGMGGTCSPVFEP